MPGEPREARFRQLEEVRVRYSDSGGAGSPVVLIHGFASSLETWAAVAPALTQAHRVISLDLKGFGWTDRPEGDYSPQAQARLVLALMNELKVTQAAIVGHSYGAAVALAVALAAPDRVANLTLVDAFVYEEQLPPFFIWARASGLGETLFALYYDQRPDERLAMAFYDKSHVTEQLIEDVERALERPGTKAAALAAIRDQRFSQWQSDYQKVKAKTLVVWGREDKVTPLWVGERLARDLSQSRLVVYPRCGHFPMIEAADATSSELLRFFSEAK